MADSDFNYQVDLPNTIFTEARSFKALANGKIYVGNTDTDPVNPSNRVPVFMVNEDGSTVQMSQPIIINAGGHPVYNGQIISKLVTDSSYSLAIYNAYGSQEYYFPNVSNINATAAITDLLNSLSGRVYRLNSVSDMKLFDVHAGYVYQTEGYYTAGDGGGALYLATTTGTTPDGYSDHVASNGVFLRLISQELTDLNCGVKVDGGVLDAATAWRNRNALQYGTRNTRYNKFTCKAAGIYCCVGAVNISRDNYFFHVSKGTVIRGYYDDPSIPESTVSQGGGFLAFGHFFNPDIGDFIPYANGDTRVNPPCIGSTVQLDGEVSTIYRDVHSNKYNNNPIAFLKGRDCKVTGSGGIGESDHRGINFDGIVTNAPNGSDNRGGSINCEINVSYINNCVNNPMNISADLNTPSLNKMICGYVGAMRPGGYNNPIVVNAGESADFYIEIGTFKGDNVIKPALIATNGCRSVVAKIGICDGAKSLIYGVDTYDTFMEITEVYNTPVGIQRAGTLSGHCRTITLTGIKATDSQFKTAVATINNNGPFVSLNIYNNNFSYITTGFSMHGGRTTGALPLNECIYDNIPSPGGDASKVFNRRTNGNSGNLATTSGQTTLSFDYKAPNWLYSKASVSVVNGGAQGVGTMDFRLRELTTQPLSLTAGGQTVMTTLSGSTITLTTTPPATLGLVVLHN